MRSPGAALCAKWEGMHKIRGDGLVYAYVCPAGYPTQGRGIVVKDLNVPPITVEEAERRFDALIAKYEAAAVKLVKVPLTANQRGALGSFCFNVGETQLRASTLLRKLNRGDPIEEVAAEFHKWNKAGGRVFAGLTKRRAEEAALFLT